MELHGKNIIAGELSADGSNRFSSSDPATGNTLAPAFWEATSEEIDRALTAAAAAAKDLRALAPAARADVLEAIATGIEDLGDELLQRAAAETGLPEARLVGERGRTAAQLRMFAADLREGSFVSARIDHGDPDRKPLPKPDLRRMSIPVGPVVVFGASNFPLAFSVAGGDTASALAAGCPVVVKGHPNHPGTAELVGEVVRRAVAAHGLPSGTFSLIQGEAHATGAALVQHPSTRAVGFTGSLAGGRALFDLAAARPVPIPLYAEMGSTNPVFLLPGALAEGRVEAVADALHQSVVQGVGQFCTNPGLLIAIAGPATDALRGGLAARLQATPPGTMLHAGIRRGFRAGCERLRQAGGVREAASRPDAPAVGDCQAEPTLFVTDAASWLANPELAEEVFGPSTLLVECVDAAQMREVAESLQGQLTATVHGEAGEIADHRDLLQLLEEVAGRLILNGYPTGVEVCAAMHHGGPYPATTDSRSTSVGNDAIQRFLRPVAYQGIPAELLPPALRDDNPLGILRLVDGTWTREGWRSA